MAFSTAYAYQRLLKPRISSPSNLDYRSPVTGAGRRELRYPRALAGAPTEPEPRRSTSAESRWSTGSRPSSAYFPLRLGRRAVQPDQVDVPDPDVVHRARPPEVLFRVDAGSLHTAIEIPIPMTSPYFQDAHGAESGTAFVAAGRLAEKISTRQAVRSGPNISTGKALSWIPQYLPRLLCR